MRLARAVDDLFTSPSHAKILRALVALPQGMPVSARELARRAGVSHPTASRALDALRRQGVVEVRRSPASDAYTFNEVHEAAAILRELFRWERAVLPALVDLLSRELRTQAPWVSEAYLFGSAARGEMAVQSDLDVACICPPGRVAELESVGGSLDDLVSRRFGNHLGLLIGTRTVATMGRLAGRSASTWRKVAEEGIPLVPSPPEGP